MIDSPAMASRMAAVLNKRIPVEAYEVRLDADGKLHWIEQGAAGGIRHHTEPGTSFWQRAAVGFISLLPIDWML